MEAIKEDVHEDNKIGEDNCLNPPIIEDNFRYKTLSFVVEEEFCIKSEGNKFTQIGIHHDGKDNLYILLVEENSLKLFMIRYDFNELKFYAREVGKLPKKASFYQADVHTCNINRDSNTEIIWFIWANEQKLQLTIDMDKKENTIFQYSYDGHWADTTLFMVDRLPCTIGGGGTNLGFTYMDECDLNFLIYPRKHPLAFTLLGGIYVIGGNTIHEANASNLMEFHSLPHNDQYKNSTKFKNFKRDWSKRLKYSNRCVFDNDDVMLSINAKDDAACVVDTKINIFKSDSFANSYFYSHDIISNTWHVMNIINNLAEEKIAKPVSEDKTSCISLEGAEKKKSDTLKEKNFTVINMYGQIHICFLEEIKDKKIKLKLFKLI